MPPTFSQKEKVIEKCMEYNTLCNSAKDASKALEEDLKSFGTNYESDFSEEVDNLNSWCIESSLYTEFSMTPSGTMSNYANQNSTYHDNLNRFQKIAESCHTNSYSHAVSVRFYFGKNAGSAFVRFGVGLNLCGNKWSYAFFGV